MPAVAFGAGIYGAGLYGTVPPPTIEVEFVPGTWTDVTPDVDFGVGWSFQVGRTSPQSTASTSTLTFTLRNPLGRYTPGVAMLGPDPTGVRAPNPLYPNILTGRRVRGSTAAGVRWAGKAASWSPTMANGMLGVCQVVAVDLLDQLSRVTMAGAIAQEVGFDGPVLYWPLTDAAGATSGVEAGGGPPVAVAGGAAGGYTFGDTGPGSGDGTGVRFTPPSSTTGSMLGAPVSIPAGPGVTVECWVNSGALSGWGGSMSILGLGLVGAAASPTAMYVGVDASGRPTYVEPGAVVTGTASIMDGGWHHLAVTVPAGGSATFWIDGAGITAAPVSPLASGVAGARLILGDSYYWSANPLTGPQRWFGNIGQVAIYDQALAPTRVAVHYQSGMGWVGETVDARIRRFLTYAGLDTPDMLLDPSTVTLGTYPQAGKDVGSACQELTATEGGGAVFYVHAGIARFRNRSARNNRTPVLILDAQGDALASPFTPVLDSSQLVNRQGVDRATGSGTQNTVQASDAASIAEYGLYAAPNVTSYAATDAEALALAQYLVAQNREPGFRLPQIAVDLRSARTDLSAQLQAVAIGSRIRVTGLPAAASPVSQLDVFVEGWTETLTVGPYTVVFDTSPADNPAAAVWGAFKWQAAGLTLSVTVTTGSASLIVMGASVPMFTQVGGAYPLDILVDAEILTVTAAPASATSPQTLTVLRGRYGTAAAPHAAGAAVTLYPRSTWTL